jgi:hypothetical protein
MHVQRQYLFVRALSFVVLACALNQFAQGQGLLALDPKATDFISTKCLDCHTGEAAEAGFDIANLMSSPIDDQTLARWANVHDRVAAGEMPPDDAATAEQRKSFTDVLFPALVDFDRQLVDSNGRTLWRRMNRYEYENALRDLLGAPWLQVKNILPEDGESQRFNKIGEALDVSHVNLARYMQAIDYALHQVIATDPNAPQATIKRYYARDDYGFSNIARFSEFNRDAERSSFPLIGHEADIELLRDPTRPFSAGESNPEVRDKEAFGVVAGSYEPIEVKFAKFRAPYAGLYKLRFKGYSFTAGGQEKNKMKPDREKISKGMRSEPVIIHSVLPPRQLRRLAEFDFYPDPSVQEIEVYLLKGETIQPDSARMFRPRPPNWKNPLASDAGIPGVAYSYMEAEGPIYENWPLRGHKLLFGDLPLEQLADGKYQIVSKQPIEDATRLVHQFLEAAYRRSPVQEEFDGVIDVIKTALDKNYSFQEAMIAGYTAALCAPAFVCLEEPAGQLDDAAIASRLSLFLWNTTPDETLRQLASGGQLSNPDVLRAQVQRLLDDDRSERFINAFLAYWLDLRNINKTSPDEILYPDYYLDDQLADSALMETQMFFREMVRENLPARTLIDSDFIFVNERLAKHYQLPMFEGASLRKVSVPEDSPRGGLLTQASILKVTANGTTTSPVIRGAWINERIMGNKVPPPPKSVPAIEPDTRGAITIRQQLELHRADASCAGCHAKIDPIGFALESFDVAGAWRENYRSLGQEGEPMVGIGKNGQPFTFRTGPAVDCSGQMENGEKFKDIYELKTLLLKEQRAIAKNLLQKFVIYSTGAQPHFSDRVEIDRILNNLADQEYPVRSMIEQVVVSRLFLEK